jgi:hypothetical protein
VLVICHLKVLRCDSLHGTLTHLLQVIDTWGQESLGSNPESGRDECTPDDYETEVV